MVYLLFLFDMSYWYRPNVYKRRWGSYGSIKNDWYSDNYSLNRINDNYDPDVGDEDYKEEDDVDLHPDIYTQSSYFDPDNEPERVDKPDIINEDFSKTEDSLFEDPDYEEYNNEIGSIDYPSTEDEDQEEVKEEPPKYELINPNNPEQILTYDDNTLKILDGVIDINNNDELIDTLSRVDETIKKNNEALQLEDSLEDETIPIVVTDRNDKVILADNIEEEKIPQLLEELKDKPPMEEVEFIKDNNDPDRHIIPPRPPRERRTIKEWIDRSRDSGKRKHHLEENNYQPKREYEEGEKIEREIAIEETKKEIDNKEEVKEEIIETQPEQRITREVEVEEEVDNWRDQDKIFNELRNQTNKSIKKKSNHKYINTNRIQEKVEELKKAIDEKDKDQDLKELNRMKQELAKIKKSIDANHKLPLLMSKPSTTSKIDHEDQKDPNYSKEIDKLVEQEEEDLRTSNIQETSLDTLTLSDQQKYWNNFKHNDGIEGGNDVNGSNEVDLEGEEEEIEQEEEPEIEYEYEYEYEY